MMLHLLLLPFRLIGGVLHAVFGILGGVLGLIGGIIGTVFGLLGGLVSLIWNLLAIALIVGLITSVVNRRKKKTVTHDDGWEFTSFYDHR